MFFATIGILSAQAYCKIIARVRALVAWLLGPSSGLDTQWDCGVQDWARTRVSTRANISVWNFSHREWHKCDRISLRKLRSYMGAFRHRLTHLFHKNIFPPFLSFVSSCILVEDSSPRTKHGKTLSSLDDTRIFGRDLPTRDSGNRRWRIRRRTSILTRRQPICSDDENPGRESFRRQRVAGNEHRRRNWKCCRLAWLSVRVDFLLVTEEIYDRAF